MSTRVPSGFFSYLWADVINKSMQDTLPPQNRNRARTLALQGDLTGDLAQGNPVDFVHDGKNFCARDLGLKKVQFESSPFSSGKFRDAYKGEIFLDQGDEAIRKELTGWNFNAEKMPCIVKAFKDEHALKSKDWEKDLTVMKEAQSWSKKFNQRGMSTIKIEFATPVLYEVFNTGESRTMQKKERVCVEPFLEGEFIKANTNCGYVAKQTSENEDFIKVAQAFSHWTWVASEKSLLISDLQGVYETSTTGQKGWKFTDPAIHCAAGKHRFGQTDLGPRGINAFFTTHVCNEMCRRLPRLEVVVDVGLPPVSAGRTSFSFEFEFVQVSADVHDQQAFADILDHAHKGTCYAQALATVVRAAEARIVGRKPEAHRRIVERIVQKYGTNGVSHSKFLELLNAECTPRNLHCSETDDSGVGVGLLRGRAMLVAFSLTKDQWRELTAFFKTSPSGTLSSLPPAPVGGEFEGHAAVIIGQDCDGESWKIKNSWGEDFADHGYFKISQALLGHCRPAFFDIVFYQHELGQGDLDAYKKHLQTAELHSV